MVRLVALTTLAASIAAAHAFTLDAWSSRDFTGSQFQTSRTGTFNVGFKAQSYKFSTFPGDGCCVKFCDGGRETGSRCGSFSNPSVLPQNRFNKVVLGCGSTVLNCWYVPFASFAFTSATGMCTFLEEIILPRVDGLEFLKRLLRMY